MPRRRHLERPEAHAAFWAVAGIVCAFVVARNLPLHLDLLGDPLVLVLAVLPVLANTSDFRVVRPLSGRDAEEKHALDEASVVLLFLLLPPGAAWLLSWVGYSIGAVLRRSSRVKLAFNVGQWSVSLGLAAMVFSAAASGQPGTLAVRDVAAVTAAVAVHAAVNYYAVGLVVCRSTGVSWGVRVAATLRLWAMTQVGNLLLGLAATALWLQGPWLVGAALAMAALVRHAYASAVMANERADEVDLDRDRLQLVIGDATTGIAVLDADGRVTVWNRTMERLTGVAAADATGRLLADATAGQLHGTQTAPGPAGTVAGEPDPGPMEVTLRHPSGEERIVAVTHSLQRDRLGIVACDVVQLVDLTAEREAARSKDDFLARVTHELRTPLTSIIGSGRTLQRLGDEIPAETRDKLRDSLVRAGEEMERLVDNLLLVSSGQGRDSGRSPRLVEDAQLATSVATAVALERADHPGRAVRVVSLPDVRASVDPDWIVTVVRHLVDNAFKFSASDSMVVVEVDGDGEEAIVRVSDEGRGIPPSKLATIFDRFARVEDPLLMETRGAGLGLFIVKRLVTRLGGRVSVDSTLGKGSTFEVRFPAGAAATEPQRVARGRTVDDLQDLTGAA